MRASLRMGQVLGLVVLVTGCSPSPATTTAAHGRSLLPAMAPSASPNTGNTTPDVSTLPGGLDPRLGLPPLVNGEAAACIPGCGVGRVAGGAIPAGRYQTRWFFGGYMSVETNGAWSLREDSNGELAILLPGDPEYAVAFWLDPEPYLHGQAVSGVGRQAGAFMDWLAAHPDLVVSTPEAASIGRMPAMAVDIELAATAGQDEADCGADPCITFIKNPAFGHVGGILGDDVYRFYFANVAYSGTDHLLVVMVEGRDRSHLGSITPTVDELLRSVTLPALPGAS